MKKISSILVAIMVAVFGFALTACGKDPEVAIILSQTNVEILLDENGEGSAVVTAKPQGLSVGSVSLDYDNSNINITPSRNSDGSFNLLITPKGQNGCNNVEVKVGMRGKATATFFVTVVVGLKDIIVLNETVVVPFNSNAMSYNLLENLTSDPILQRPLGIDFSINKELAGLSVDGNYLKLDENFSDFDEILTVTATSTEKVDAPIFKTFYVKIVPNVVYYADQIIMQVDQGSGIAARDDENNILKDAETGECKYNLVVENSDMSTFDVYVRIPTALGIEVGVDSLTNPQTNIMQAILINSQKSKLVEIDGKEYTQTVFSFETANQNPMVGRLYFEFKYKNYNNALLNNSFVVAVDESGNNLKAGYITLNIEVPLTEVLTNTDCAIYEGKYVVFSNYANMSGEEFAFIANPQTATQKTYKVTEITNLIVKYWDVDLREHKALEITSDADGNLVYPEINFGTKLFIVAEGVGFGTLKVEAKGKSEPITKILNFDCKDGATGLCFVEDEGEPDGTTDDKTVLIECGDNATVCLYAPGATNIDFEDENKIEGLTISATATAGYFNLEATLLEPDTKTYTINTANGYVLTLNVEAIKTLQEAIIKAPADIAENSAIGRIEVNAGRELLSVSLKNGYSLPLEFVTTPNAELSSIKYSFCESTEDEVYNAAYISFASNRNMFADPSYDYSVNSNVVKRNNLADDYVLAASGVGKVIVKVEFVGYKVQDGQKVAGDPITKFIVVEVYRPLIDISVPKNPITLRAEENLIEENKSHCEEKIDITTISEGNRIATYNHVYIDGAELEVSGTEWYAVLTHTSYIAKLNLKTSELTVKALKRGAFNDHQIKLFATNFFVDHVKHIDEGLPFNFDMETIASGGYNCIPYTINLKIIETKGIEDISVFNLLVNKEEQNVGGYQKVKTYEELYFTALEDGEEEVYELIINTLPMDAFNNQVNISFAPENNSDANIISISDNKITYGSKGGTGKITITSKDPNNKLIKVVIPITIANGTKEAPFVVSNLLDITSSDKFYKIKDTSAILEAPKTLFTDFSGGLDGNGAIIKIIGNAPLFGNILADAEIKNVKIIGDVTGYGFVANTNKGTIDNVYVDTYIKNINNDLTFIPSLLTVPNDAISTTPIGGIVGSNEGTVKNCTFAGSISLVGAPYANAEKVSGICIDVAGGDSKTGNKIIQAKFRNVTANSGRLVLDATEGVYVNGLINETSSEAFAGASKGTPLDETVKSVSQSGVQQVFADADGKNAIVFYFESKDASKQTDVDTYNTIALKDLIDENARVIVVGSENVRNNLTTIAIKGTGAFSLKAYSIFDYTIVNTFNFYALHYVESLTLKAGNKNLASGDVLQINNGYTKQIKTVINSNVGGVEIVKDDFDVSFSLTDDDVANIINANTYITGTKTGSHTITGSWVDNLNSGVTLGLLVSIIEDQSMQAEIAKFNELLNDYLDLTSYNLTATLVEGTTDIFATVSEVEMEPRDSVSFTATLNTSNNQDAIYGNTEADQTSTIKILDFNNVDKTSLFNIEAEKVADKKFDIKISLTDDGKKDTSLASQEFSVIIKSAYVDEDPNNTIIYEAYITVTLTILPQTLSSVNATIYNFTTISDGGNTVNKTELPTSTIKPTDSALLFIDLFPSFASYDYVEITTTSNKLAKLAYAVQKKTAENKYVYDNTVSVSELTGADGIRILNNTKGTETQEIGSYYILIYPTNTLNEDCIININVRVYYQGQVLQQSASLTLYVKTPEKPQISVDGETVVFVYPGETITANIVLPENQTYSEIEILNDDGDNPFINDGDVVTTVNRAESINSSYTRYTLTMRLSPDIKITEQNNRLRIIVKSIKIDRGEPITVKAELIAYLVPFKVGKDAMQIKDVNGGAFRVNSIKYSNLELYLNFMCDNASEYTQEALEDFTEDYFYSKDFDNYNFIIGNETITLSAGQQLATYLYYINGNTSAQVAYVDASGEVVFNYSDYKKYVVLEIDELTKQLKVKGGEFTGSVPMELRVPYTMPNGDRYIYVYEFTIVNAIYTTEDTPMEIADSTSFVNIPTTEFAQDYILSNDLYLYEYSPMIDTSKILSLDGNNHTIHIVSFARPETTSINYALFQSISSTTTIKNLTVNYYYLPEINIADEITSLNFAGVAINNAGVVANCEVVAFKGKEKSPSFVTYGIKLAIGEKSVADVNVAGFVLNNIGSITNSRVGGDEKLTTEFDYTVLNNPKLKTQKVQQQLFTIRASGTISGFVGNNTGVIASSFVKRVNIVNNYNQDQTKVTTGFANENNGTIAMSYVEGVRNSSLEVQASSGGILGSGILAGFVYKNNKTISDCYSNIRLKSGTNQVGRLGAGFVFENGAGATIKTSYSFSQCEDNATSQLYFAGVSDTLEYNNKGLIKNCYYYVTSAEELDNIETLYNTDITPVEHVNNELSFYGFSISGSEGYDLDATWKLTETGPELCSANEIAHSVRFKYLLNNEGGNSSLDYYFVYASEYEYGTKNNPIIIRNAKEFNGVLGGYYGTNEEIEKNYDKSNGKVYGSYRLVNNIDLNDLIIQDEQQVEKYTLASTEMTLTGENKGASLRTGSFNGNGLTIQNLSISTTTAGITNYGMFKSIESGAFFGNVNIVLSEGGISADHTENVGAIAGTLKSSALVNVNISSNAQAGETTVVGANIVGGAVGKVIGNSYISGVSISGVSVTATYNKTQTFTAGAESLNANLFDRLANSNNTKSLAGGLFGVIDVYVDKEESENLGTLLANLKHTNVTNVHVSGGFEIMGMTAGGVAGYIGEDVTAKDISLTITNSQKPAQIIAYSCFAGGIAGYNSGNLYQVKAEHEQEWQTQIEKNINKYYQEEDEQERTEIDRGNLSLFKSDMASPIAIGGLVGVMNAGLLEVAYSKVNVISNTATYAGGVIGFVNGEGEEKIELTEVYSISDVCSEDSGYTAGIIGINKFSNDLMLNKVAALNYWSIDEESALQKVTNFAQIDNRTEGESIDGKSVIKLSHLGGVEWEGGTDVSGKTAKIIAKLTNAELNNIEHISIPAYKNYAGIETDNGAQIDVAFKEYGWYDANWKRDNNQMFPQIKYTIPTSIFYIYDVNDLEFLRYYGSNRDAVFIVMAEQPIPCETFIATIRQPFRAKITGFYETSGFSSLQYSLFEEIDGGTIDSLNFEYCSKSTAKKVTSGGTFANLRFKNCNFTNNNGQARVAGVVEEIINGSQEVTFEGISFDTCTMGTSQENVLTHVGFLVAKSEAKFKAENITIIGRSEIDCSVASNANIGLLFGFSGGEVKLKNINVNGTIDIIAQNETEGNQELSVGLIGASLTKVTLQNINISESSQIIVDTQKNDNGNNATSTLRVGGIIAKASDMSLSGNVSVLNSIEVKPAQRNGEMPQFLYVGGIVGEAKILTAVDASGKVVVGWKDGGTVGTQVYKTIKTHVAKFTVVGGIAGLVTEANLNNSNYVVYNGDISLTQSKIRGGRVRIGGIFGIVSDDSTINSAIYAGTIGFNNTLIVGDGEYDQPYYIGGIIGKTTGAVTFAEVYSIGQINLSGKNSSNQPCNLSTQGACYVSGVIGQTEKNVTFDDGKTEELEIDNTTILTTIHNATNNSAYTVDAVLQKSEGTISISSPQNVYYSSNLTLCVSTQEDAINKPYKAIVDNNEGTRLNDNIGTVITKFRNTYSSICPAGYSADNDSVNMVGVEGILDVEDSKLSAPNRKVYVCVVNSIGDASQPNEVRLELENIHMFADGETIITTVTPFKKIDENSSVSGFVAKSKISQNDGFAGFVDENCGVVYTCSVVEPLDTFKQTGYATTDFYSVVDINISSGSPNIGGFVAVNSGYIFGCNSNTYINIQVNRSAKYNAGGFAGRNLGKIEYSYANGYIKSNSANGLVDLFANNRNNDENTSSDVGTVTNCYTLFTNMCTDIAPTTSANYEQDASEANSKSLQTNAKVTAPKGVSETTLKGYANGYYSSSDEHNGGYPTLSGGPFTGLTYLKTSSYVYMNIETVNNSGIYSAAPYYTEHPVANASEPAVETTKPTLTPNEIYTKVFNITLFKGITSGNYVITRDLNFGYKYTNTKAGATSDSEYSYDSSIATITGNISIDGNNQVIYDVSLSADKYLLSNNEDGTHNVAINENSQIFNLTFNTVNLYSATGLIQQNKGLIYNVKIQNEVVVENTVEFANIGTLVETNNGKIYNCQISASISSTGKSNASYYYGGLVGQQSDGIISDCVVSAMVPNVKIFQSDQSISFIDKIEGGTLYFGGIAGLVAGGEITKCKAKSLQAEVVAETVYVGGIAGYAEGGTISKCSVDDNSNIVAGREEITKEVVGGVEITNDVLTKESYAGGIVGNISTKLTITSCENNGDITARAQWKEVSGEDRRYVYNEDANSIYIYDLLESTAYAGGIAGTGLENADANSKHLANNGVVSGGFKAWKPIGRLSAEPTSERDVWARVANSVQYVAEAESFGTVAGLGMGMLYGARHGAKFGIKGAIIGAVVGAIGGAINLAVQTHNNRKIANAWKLYYTPYDGNSSAFDSIDANTTKDHLNALFNGEDEARQTMVGNAWCSEITSLTIENRAKAKYYDNGVPYLYYSYWLTGGTSSKSVLTAKGSKNIKGKDNNIQVLQAIYYDGICSTATPSANYYSSTPNYKTMVDATVYNWDNATGVTEEDVGTEYTLNTASEANQALKFRWFESSYRHKNQWGENDYNYQQAEINPLSLTCGKEEHEHSAYGGSCYEQQHDGSMTLNCDRQHKHTEGCYTISYNSENNLLNPKAQATIEGMKDWDGFDENGLTETRPTKLAFNRTGTEGNYSYSLTLTDPAKYENLAYTLNNGLSEYFNEGSTTPTTATEPILLNGTNVTVKIALDGSNNNVFVGDAIIDEFNGIFEVGKNQEGQDIAFYGMVVKFDDCSTTEEHEHNSDCYAYGGLIKQSHSAIIKNFTYGVYNQQKKLIATTVELTDKGNDINRKGPAVFGTIIGNVISGGERVEITDCNINISIVQISTKNKTADRLINFGGAIGVVAEGNVLITDTVSTSKTVTIGHFNPYCTSINMQEQTNSFGGLIAQVQSGATATLNQNIAVTIGSVNRPCNISCYGGIVGYNAGTVKNDDGAIDVNIQTEFKGASMLNTYVGGVVGHNNGTLNARGINVTATNDNVVISADVLNGEKSAYAGGVAGYNQASITCGSINVKAKNVGYKAVLSILAGYNTYELVDGFSYVLPSSASASASVGTGTDFDINCSHVYVSAIAITNTATGNVEMASGITTSDTFEVVNYSGAIYSKDGKSYIEHNHPSGECYKYTLICTNTDEGHEHVDACFKREDYTCSYTPELADYGFTVSDKTITSKYVNDTINVDFEYSYEIVESKSYYNYDGGNGQPTYEITIKFTNCSGTSVDKQQVSYVYKFILTANNSKINGENEYLLSVILTKMPKIKTGGGYDMDVDGYTVKLQDCNIAVFSEKFNSSTINFSLPTEMFMHQNTITNGEMYASKSKTAKSGIGVEDRIDSTYDNADTFTYYSTMVPINNYTFVVSESEFKLVEQIDISGDVLFETTWENPNTGESEDILVPAEHSKASFKRTLFTCNLQESNVTAESDLVCANPSHTHDFDCYKLTTSNFVNLDIPTYSVEGGGINISGEYKNLDPKQVTGTFEYGATEHGTGYTNQDVDFDLDTYDTDKADATITYEGKEINSILTHELTQHGKNYKIVTLVEEAEATDPKSIIDLVYEVNSEDKFALVKKLTYTLSSSVNVSVALANRYQSLFPSWGATNSGHTCDGECQPNCPDKYKQIDTEISDITCQTFTAGTFAESIVIDGLTFSQNTHLQVTLTRIDTEVLDPTTGNVLGYTYDVAVSQTWTNSESYIMQLTQTGIVVDFGS